ncbi:MAG: hypothetical protein ACR2RV_25950 [Verrucomicrobiales bacterium]
MSLHTEIENQFKSLPLFSRLGENWKLERGGMQYACISQMAPVGGPWSQAWLDVRIKWKGDLTEHLFLHAPKQYARWTKIEDKVWKTVERSVGDQVREGLVLAGQPEAAIEYVLGDLALYGMSYAYREASPPSYFDALFAVYRSGHCPFGSNAVQNPAGQIDPSIVFCLWEKHQNKGSVLLA